MTWSGWRRGVVIGFLVSCFLGCAMPSASQSPPLTAAAAKHTLNTWNPSFCKVAEFYGFYKSANNPANQVAYVLIANPRDKAQKPLIYAARFQLLTTPDGQMRWYLVSLISHSAGLSRRQGWDNLMIPVKPPSPAAAK